MNDTIVIYDRVRENMRSMRRDNLTTIVNAAVGSWLVACFVSMTEER